MNKQIAKMYIIQQQILDLYTECTKIGKETFGESYEDCYLDEESMVLTVYEDEGHDYDLGESYYDMSGDEVDD